MQQIRKFLPGRIPIAVGLDHPRSGVVARVTPKDIEIVAISNNRTSSSRVLQGSDRFPLSGRKVILFTCRQQSMLIRSILSASNGVKILLVDDADVCIASVYHVGICLQR